MGQGIEASLERLSGKRRSRFHRFRGLALLAPSWRRIHWPKLTLFLRQSVAPIDNNIVERALKKAILNRKNAFFYKTLNGAGVGDLFMSLIHTCELNGANPFHYLSELQRHAKELKQTPSE